jgi:hypothetical protein
MIGDIAILEKLAAPQYVMTQTAQSQQSPINGYRIDARGLLNMNLPANAPVAFIKTKQVLSGKMAAIDTIAEEFPKLVKQWKDETFFHSSLTKVFTHPAYLRIIAMGKPGLPLVLSELRDNPDRWFHALKYMAGVDVSAGMKDSDDARYAWLEWGYKNHYI